MNASEPVKHSKEILVIESKDDMNNDVTVRKGISDPDNLLVLRDDGDGEAVVLNRKQIVKLHSILSTWLKTGDLPEVCP